MLRKFIVKEIGLVYTMEKDAKAIMDTNFWIHLKIDESYRNEFEEAVQETDVTVLFSFGNFIDLLKAEEQDELSNVITDLTDTYIPYQSYSGNEYDISDSPISLIPKEPDRKEFLRQADILDDDLALSYLFRTSQWDTPKDYLDLTVQMKRIYDEFGFENSMGYIFKEYLEPEGNKLKLSQHHVDAPEFIRGMLELNRIHQMQDTEKPDSNDFADMEISAHALITDCDYLFIESKWINTGVIDMVVSKLNRDGPKLHDDYDEFLSALSC